MATKKNPYADARRDTPVTVKDNPPAASVAKALANNQAQVGATKKAK